MKILLAGLLTLSTMVLKGQEQMLADSNAVKSINGILKEVLRIVSGEEGKTRNWQAFKNLFLRSANLTVLSQQSASPSLETVSLNEFIDLMEDEYYTKGFLEYETGKVVNEYNGIANVFQSFYARDSENKEERGINSYQLVYLQSRWWIANILWTTDSNGVRIPAKYLRKHTTNR